MSLGKRLKEIRLEMNMNRPQMGELLHITRHAIFKYEADEILPALPKLILIAERANVHLDWLLAGIGPKYRAIEQENGKRLVELDTAEQNLITFIRANEQYMILFEKYRNTALAKNELSAELRNLDLPSSDRD